MMNKANTLHFSTCFALRSCHRSAFRIYLRPFLSMSDYKKVSRVSELMMRSKRESDKLFF